MLKNEGTSGGVAQLGVEQVPLGSMRGTSQDESLDDGRGPRPVTWNEGVTE